MPIIKSHIFLEATTIHIKSFKYLNPSSCYLFFHLGRLIVDLLSSKCHIVHFIIDVIVELVTVLVFITSRMVQLK